MWDLGCLQQFYWGFWSSGMWCCNTLYLFPKILRECSAFEMMASTNSASHSRRPEPSSISRHVKVNVFNLQSTHSPGSVDRVDKLSLAWGVSCADETSWLWLFISIRIDSVNECDGSSKRGKTGLDTGVNLCLPVIHLFSTNQLLGRKALPGFWFALSGKAECTVV